jgi:hypothetical protein
MRYIIMPFTLILDGGMKKLVRLVITFFIGTKNMDNIYTVINFITDFITNKLGKISAETLGWVANICLHAATVPSLLAFMTGVTDITPSVDVVLMLWAALGLLFFRAVLLRDLLNIVTIGVGFMVQAVTLVLIFFK